MSGWPSLLYTIYCPEVVTRQLWSLRHYLPQLCFFPSRQSQGSGGLVFLDRTAVGTA